MEATFGEDLEMKKDISLQVILGIYVCVYVSKLCCQTNYIKSKITSFYDSYSMLYKIAYIFS